MSLLGEHEVGTGFNPRETATGASAVPCSCRDKIRLPSVTRIGLLTQGHNDAADRFNRAPCQALNR